MKSSRLTVIIVFISNLIICNELIIKVTDKKGTIIETRTETIGNDYQNTGKTNVDAVDGQTIILFCNPKEPVKQKTCTFTSPEPDGEVYDMTPGASYEGG